MVKDKAYVLKEVKDKNVKFIRLWFTDVLGFLKSFSISPDELDVFVLDFLQDIGLVLHHDLFLLFPDRPIFIQGSVLFSL